MEDRFTNQEEQMNALAKDFSLAIDTSELWENVEAQLPPVEDDRRRPFVWWFASGFLIIALGLFAWQFDFESENNNPTINTISELQNEMPEQSSISTLSSEETEIKLSSTPKEINTEKEQAYSQIPANTLVAKTQTITPNLHQPQTSFTLNSTVTKSLPSNSFTPNSSALFTVKSENANETLNTHTQESLIASTNEIEKIKREIFSFNFLETKSIDYLENFDPLEIPNRIVQPLQIASWLPYYTFASGINHHQRSLYSDSGEGLDLTQFENEKSLIGFSTNLGFGFENSAGWRLGLSLDHNRIVNRFSQRETFITTTETQGNEASKIDSDGNITFITGTITTSTITEYDVKWHRNHDFLNVQFNLGKRIFQNGNFAFYTDANISKNIWSRHSGYYFEENSQSVNKFSSQEENPYTGSGYNAGLSFGLEYKINNISISLSPFASVGLNSITKLENYYQLKNSQYGVQLGVVYRP